MSRKVSVASSSPSSSNYHIWTHRASLNSISEKDSLEQFLTGRKSHGLIDNAELYGKIKVLSNMNSDTCLSVTLSPDGKYYAVALANGLVNAYNSKNDNLIYTLNKPKEKSLHDTDTSCTCVRFRPFRKQSSPEGNHVEGRDEGSKGRLDELKPDHLLPRLVTNRRRSSAWSTRRDSSADADLLVEMEETLPKPDYLLTATFTNGKIKTFRILTEDCIQTIEENRDVLTMCYDPSGKFFVTSGGDGALNIYDAEKGHKFMSHECRFNENGKFRRVYSIVFHPQEESQFLAGGWDGNVRFYDIRSPRPYRNIPDQFICGEGVAFHPSGNEFCTASWSRKNSLQIYDYRSAKRLAKYDFSSESSETGISHSLSSSLLYSAQYYENGKNIVLGGAEPGSLTVIDRSSGKTIAGLKDIKKSVYCLDTHKSKVVMVTGNEVALVDFFV